MVVYVDAKVSHGINFSFEAVELVSNYFLSKLRLKKETNLGSDGRKYLSICSSDNVIDVTFAIPAPRRFQAF